MELEEKIDNKNQDLESVASKINSFGKILRVYLFRGFYHEDGENSYKDSKSSGIKLLLIFRIMLKK